MEVFNIILIIGVAQGFVFNGINFYNYKFKNKTIIFLNLFVLFLTLNNLQAWLIEKNIRFSFYYLKHLLVPWYIIITPMFFLFLSKYLQLKKRLKVLIYTTITLFLTSIITRLLILYFLNDIQNESKFLLSLKLYNNVEEVIGFFFAFSLFIYCIFIFLKTFNSANKILEYDNLNWLKIFFWLGLVIMLFWLVAIIINTVFSFSNPTIIYSPLRISTSILIYWLGYQGMYQQKFVDHRISLRKKLSQQTSFPKKSNGIIEKKISINKKNYF